MRKKLREIVENTTTKEGKAFDYFIQALIIISLISFAVETLPQISAETRKLLEIIEVFTVSVFTLEYLLRIIVSRKPLKYIFSFYGIIDLLAIFPFYLRNSFDFRALRAFRIFRIFRALKLVRYNLALNRFQLAAKIVKEEIILFLLITLIFIYLASAGIYFFENESQPEVFSSVFHSAWWAVVTLTTVGYGDVYPITVGGKFFTFFILLIGVGIVTIPAGLVATALSKARELQESEKIKIK